MEQTVAFEAGNTESKPLRRWARGLLRGRMQCAFPEILRALVSHTSGRQAKPTRQLTLFVELVGGLFLYAFLGFDLTLRCCPCVLAAMFVVTIQSAAHCNTVADGPICSLHRSFPCSQHGGIISGIHILSRCQQGRRNHIIVYQSTKSSNTSVQQSLPLIINTPNP